MIKNLLLLVLSLIITISLAELVLRKLGYVPGQLRSSPWLQKVDELYPLSGFKADEYGIFKVDTSICRKIEADRTEAERWFDYIKHRCMAELPVLYFDHAGFSKYYKPSNELSLRFEGLQHHASQSAYDSVLAHFQQFPVNADGFYSIPFNTTITGKTKVLLLGDSFTWGHSTKNKTGSFANVLLARDFLVYNTGISGADMAQYMRILETYLDSIDPDIVILNFYVGNDVSYYTRIPESGLPIHFNTNAGNLMAFQDGEQFHDMQAAYDNIMKNTVIPQTTLVNRLLSKTAVTTMAWKASVRLGIIHHDYFIAQPRPVIPLCNQEMDEIRAFCDSRNKKFILSIIPNLVDGSLKGVASVPHLFDGISYHEPQMTIDMYRAEDGHFNDVGHLFYAIYLEKLILTETWSD
jgi:hypothetical protein